MSRDRFMVLDAQKAVVPADISTWSDFLDGDGKRVGRTEVGEASVSTVFLGVDHSFGDGPPLWFETMIFGGPFDQETWRYTTWAEAEAGHGRIVGALREGREP